MALSRRVKRRIKIIVALFLLVAGFFLLDVKIKQSVLTIARSQVQLQVAEMMQEIILDHIVSQLSYDEIMVLHQNDRGQIILLQANVVELNRVMARSIQELSVGLQSLRESNIKVPLGQVTGISYLAGYGPSMNIRIIPAGQVYVSVDNRFQQAGINQTRHLIYMDMEAELKIAVPFMQQAVNVQSTIPLAESIIVGEVPQTYVSLGNISNWKTLE